MSTERLLHPQSDPQCILLLQASEGQFQNKVSPCCLLPSCTHCEGLHACCCLLACSRPAPTCSGAALEAMERLMAHWHQTTAKHPIRSPAAAAAATTPGSTRSSAGSRRRLSDAEDEEAQVLPFQQQQQRQLGGDDGGVGGSSAAPCEHVACSQQTFCLVEEMERLKRNYHGRTDQVGLCCLAEVLCGCVHVDLPARLCRLEGLVVCQTHCTSWQC